MVVGVGDNDGRGVTLGVPDALDDGVPAPAVGRVEAGGLGCRGWLGVIDGVAGVPAGGDGVGGDGVGEAGDVVCRCVGRASGVRSKVVVPSIEYFPASGPGVLDHSAATMPFL